jgi:hypothetical protein
MATLAVARLFTMLMCETVHFTPKRARFRPV